MIEIADPADGGAALRDAVTPPRRPTTGSSSPRRTAPRGCAARSTTPGSTPAPSAAPGSRPSGRPPPRRWPPAACAPTSCPSGSSPSRCSTRMTATGGPGRRCCSPGPRSRATCCPTGCAQRGWEVDVVDAYRTVPATVTDEQRAAIAGADVITFTSSSTVERFIEAVGADARAAGRRVHRAGHRGDRARATASPSTSRPTVHTVDGPGRRARRLGARRDPRSGRLRLRRPHHRQRVGHLRDGRRRRSPCTATSSPWRRGPRSSASATTTTSAAWATLTPAMGIEGFDNATFSATYAEQDRSNRDSLPLLPASRCSSTASSPRASRSAWRRPRRSSGSTATSVGSGSARASAR